MLGTSLPSGLAAALFAAFAGVMTLGLVYPQKPETCDCYAVCYKEKDSDPAYCFCMPDCTVAGECEEIETSTNHFWCKCVQNAQTVFDSCYCKSGFEYGPATGNHYRRCMDGSCSYTCYRMEDSQVPVGLLNALQGCDCH